MSNYEKIYAGILGKAIGVRLGAPIEPLQWTYERIFESFEDIRGYIKDSEIFAADDDTNGPIFFARALIDDGIENFGPETVGKTWLNYARENAGMFWWGGDGVSTEHTAYLNLKKGQIAPLTGSCQVNGDVMANQVGGQIFIDSWGLLFPNSPKQAAAYAKSAASVSHDGDGLVGAQFIAAAISYAFSEISVYAVVDKALELIDKNSEYYNILNKVYDFYRDNPNDFRKARQYVEDNFGYAHYDGACHIIPNAAICLIGLLYSQNDFSRAIEITVMCGWDTDSNAGVVGSIMGVLCGLDNIPNHYRQPINDTIIASSMSGYLNIVDIPNFALELYMMSLQLAKKSIDKIKEDYKPGELNKNFKLKGSSHGLKVDNKFRLIQDKITQKSKVGFNLLIDNLIKIDSAKVYYQTFYDDDYFWDDRYEPAFVPLAYDGQNVNISLHTDVYFIDDIWVRGYVETGSGKNIPTTKWFKTISNEILKLQFTIPKTEGEIIYKVGFEIKTDSTGIDGNGVLARLIVKAFNVSNQASYTIEPKYQKPCMLDNISSFVNNRSKSKVIENKINIEFFKEQGLSLTGNYYTSDLEFSSYVQINKLDVFNVVFMAKGLYDFYSFKLEKDTISLLKTDGFIDRVLTSKKIISANEFEFKLEVKKELVKFYYNDELVLEHFIEPSYGHFGYGGINSNVSVSKIRVVSDIINKKQAI